MDSSLAYTVATVSGLLFGASVLLLYIRRSQRSSQASVTALHADSSKDDRPVVRLCYGTQTGTAEKFAKQLASRLSEQYGEATRMEVVDMEQYDHESSLTQETLIFFIVATYGDGEPTDNCVNFYNWLLKASEDVMNGDRPEVCKGLQYGVFGLGNKQYEHFNAVGKAVHKHMEVIGGVPLLPAGLGDDDADIADDFEVWTEAVMGALDSSGLLVKTRKSLGQRPLQGYLEHPSASQNGSLMSPLQHGNRGGHAIVLASIHQVKELHTPASDRSCVEVVFDLSGSDLTYEHGDHLAVYAQNSSETVEQAAALLGLDPDTVVDLRVPEGNPEMLSEPFPCPTTLRTALAHHATLLHHPDKHALEALASCASNEDEATRLRQLASHDGKAEYASYIVAAQRSLLQVMADFPSCKPSLGLFFGHIAARLQPRYYSISSSPLKDPKHVHITVAVVDEVGPSGRRHRGVASSWLASWPKEQVPVFVRRSTFKLPKQLSTPIVMVGPGTGLAPFMGFLQHRALQKNGEALGPCTLYFGCRHPDHDYIYQEDLLGYVEGKVLTELHVAFSRVAAKKDYVQHHMLKNGEALHAAFQQGAVLYVCGEAKNMAKDVHRALHDLIMQWGKCGSSEAEAFVKDLQKAGRYLQDVW